MYACLYATVCLKVKLLVNCRPILICLLTRSKIPHLSQSLSNYEVREDQALKGSRLSLVGKLEVHLSTHSGAYQVYGYSTAITDNVPHSSFIPMPYYLPFKLALKMNRG